MRTTLRQRFPTRALSPPTRSSTNNTLLGGWLPLSDARRRVAYNTLVVVSISISLVLAVVSAYAGVVQDSEDEDPWVRLT